MQNDWKIILAAGISMVVAGLLALVFWFLLFAFHKQFENQDFLFALGFVIPSIIYAGAYYLVRWRFGDEDPH